MKISLRALKRIIREAVEETKGSGVMTLSEFLDIAIPSDFFDLSPVKRKKHIDTLLRKYIGKPVKFDTEELSSLQHVDTGAGPVDFPAEPVLKFDSISPQGKTIGFTDSKYSDWVYYV